MVFNKLKLHPAMNIVEVAKRTGAIARSPTEPKSASLALFCGSAGLGETRVTSFARTRVSATGASARPAKLFEVVNRLLRMTSAPVARLHHIAP